jgi:hypothetical protein
MPHERIDMDLIFNDGLREISFNQKNGQGIITLIYREPEAKERIQYASSIASLYRDKTPSEVQIEDLQYIQFDHGMKILEGFRAENIPINISSDPQSPQFREDWKELVGKRMTDLIISLAQSAFELGGYEPSKNL